ncbi:DUF4157 domain-containing protein [Amycolatopsis sp. NPDC059021]|uniref:eCIS core domain-containing protein n=1 Tax=Amycolatopsis sp. NPDC059021 TaxID=3346704 RepID=UPI0036709868
MPHAFDSAASRVPPGGFAPDAARSPGQPLDERTQAVMGARFGHDFSRVRVHADPDAAEAAAAVSANAYTVGEDVFFGAGQYDPSSRSGRHLLAHELGHVVQNARGGTAASGLAPDPARESSAEAAATAFTTGSGRVTVTGTGGGLARQASGRTAPPAAATAPPATNAFEEWWKKIPGLEGTVEDFERNPANKADIGGLTHLGITIGTFKMFHQSAGLPDTEEAFRAMTKAQAKKIAFARWKLSHADQIVNPGVAILVGDWHWHFPRDSVVQIKKALAPWGLNPAIGGSELDRFTIGLLNSLPPAEAIQLLTDARAGFYRDDPKRFGSFTTGLLNRVETRREQAAAFGNLPAAPDARAQMYVMMTFVLTSPVVTDAGRPGAVAWVLGRAGFSADDLAMIVKSLEPAQLKIVLAGTRASGVAAPAAAVAPIVLKRLQDGYEEARKGKNWAKVAAFLDGLDEAAIVARIGKLRPKEIDLLHQAAVGAAGLGAASPVARLTERP